MLFINVFATPDEALVSERRTVRRTRISWGIVAPFVLAGLSPARSSVADDVPAIGSSMIPIVHEIAATGPASKNPPCREQSSRSVHHLENNAGETMLILETSHFACWPVVSDSRMTVRGPVGVALRFSSRTVMRSPGRMSFQDSRFQLVFPDDTSLELKVGQPIVNAPGLTEEFPGSVFRYKGKELYFTIERPLKPVWTSKEGKAFRAMLPEDASEVMELLAEAQKVLREENVLTGFNELFVSLYLGDELGSLARDGYTLTRVSMEAQAGDNVDRTGLFGKGSTGKSAKETPTKEESVPAAGAALPTGPEVVTPSVPASPPVPDATPIPRPN
ncbi:MAG: hypothetical protein IPP07_11820 [Holophagales bacterium]|nr:hypothetical protein [Holophagales bacterium]